MWPPSRSVARRARSRFTRRPAAYSPNSVRPSVVSTTCTENPPFTARSTVRQAPFTAMLSPCFTPLYGAWIVSASPVFRFPFSVCRVALVTRPTALTIPVNIAACPIPIMYQSPEPAAPPASSAAPPQGGSGVRRETPERRLHPIQPVDQTVGEEARAERPSPFAQERLDPGLAQHAESVAQRRGTEHA